MFSFISPQALHFGRGQRAQTVELARAYGSNILLVHGSNPARAAWLVEDCAAAGLTVKALACAREPSLPDIETALSGLSDFAPDVVIAMGGGSVIDFAKALAALIRCDGPAVDYLEVVGTGRALEHPPLPIIALPTTAGTGAEVTKNAVIAVPDRGLKVSLRDPGMVPAIAIVDADLMQGAPRRVALSAGLDAVTQVIEPYLSIKATPMTDALTRAAIPTGLRALRGVVERDDSAAWDEMAWVSTCGGLALANSGLGAVHGFAGVIGGMTGAPHGEVCGALLPAVLRSHMDKAEGGETAERLSWVLNQIAETFTQDEPVAALENWSRQRGLRTLSEMGLNAEDHGAVARASGGASSMKGNPFPLTEDELTAILAAAG